MKPLWKTASLSSSLREALQRSGLERGVREQELFVRWEEIVGRTIARHALPDRMRRGVLYLKVTDAVWRQELSMQRQGLTQKINDALGDDIVREIRLR